MSQLHSITCDFCFRIEPMRKMMTQDIYLVPDGWIIETIREYCCKECKDDNEAGIAHPSTPRYSLAHDRRMRLMIYPDMDRWDEKGLSHG